MLQLLTFYPIQVPMQLKSKYGSIYFSLCKIAIIRGVFFFLEIVHKIHSISIESMWRARQIDWLKIWFLEHSSLQVHQRFTMLHKICPSVSMFHLVSTSNSLMFVSPSVVLYPTNELFLFGISKSPSYSLSQIFSNDFICSYTYSTWQFTCNAESCATASTQKYLVTFQSAFVDYTK